MFRHLNVVREPKWIERDRPRAEHYGTCLADLGFPPVIRGKPIVCHWSSGWSSVAFERVPEWRRVSFPDAGAADVHLAVLKDLGFECSVEGGGG